MELVEDAVGKHFTGTDEAVGAKVVLGGVEDHTRGAHNLQGLSRDFGANAVAADHANRVAAHLSAVLLFSMDGSGGRLSVRCGASRCYTQSVWKCPSILRFGN
jgi:hypothetical protein